MAEISIDNCSSRTVSTVSMVSTDSMDSMDRLSGLESAAYLCISSIKEGNNSQLTDSVVQILNYLESRMASSGLPIIKHVARIVDILAGLKPLLTSTFATRVVEKVALGKESKFVETMRETTFWEMLTHIKSQDWHKCTIKGVKYSCDFHLESLFCHLVSAMVASVWYLLLSTPETTDEYARFIGTLALLHDIGKPGTMNTGIISIAGKNKNVTKFPAHGLIGGMILQKAYSRDFGFSLEEWDTLCRCTTIHMCGYHCTDVTSPVTQSMWTRLSLEVPLVQQALLYLSVGDSIGNVRSHDCGTSDEELFRSREPFAQHLRTKIADPAKIFTKLLTSNLVVVITGGSGAGKTTLAMQLIAYLTSREIANSYVSRDDIMLELICPMLGLTVDKSAYAQCYKYVKENDMGKEIDAQVKQRISNSIAFGEVCIIDTMASMYRKVFNTYFSDDVLNCEILQIAVDRNVPHTQADADRLGLSLDLQIELSGLSHLTNPLAKIDLSNIAGLSCAMESRNIKRDSGNRAQCTLTTSVIWTPEFTFGLSHVFQLLGELSPGLKKGVVQRVDTQSMDVVQYVNYVYNLYECEPSLAASTQFKLKIDALIRRFAVLHFTVSVPFQLRGTKFESRVFSVKYIDGINRLWRPVWARQCRAVFFHVNDDFTCVPIKYQLQRGAELFTGMLVSANIASTQDISDARKIAILSDSQQRTCKILLAGENEGKLSAHLTEKVDGSLLTVTFYYGESAEQMKSLVAEFGDEFSQMILAGFEEFGVVGIVSTQGTLMMGNDMQDYFVTSILESHISGLGLTREFMIEEAKTNTPTQMFAKYGKAWFAYLLRVLGNLPMPTAPSSSVSNISLCFESVCANRMTVWGKLHTELAISYSSSMCLFLGASWCGLDWVLNVPHTMLNIESVDEPRFWLTTTAAQVDGLMRGLEDVVYARITTLDFLTTFPPSNKKWDSSLPLHPEGYVCYTTEGEMFGLPVVDYNKLKLAAYYIGHKFHDESVKELYELSKTASDIFPMAKKVGDFYSEIESKFYAIAQRLSQGLAPSSDNLFASNLEGKAVKAYENASPETQSKMIIGGNIAVFDTWIRDLTTEYYPTIVTTNLGSTVVKSGLKRMCMELKPWLNYKLDSPPVEFLEIIANPAKYSGISSVFLMLMNQ
jgi:hypothetical protein